jgi:predicted RNA-binding Zn-ribbon protein involved in translation (DUF1610 family)
VAFGRPGGEDHDDTSTSCSSPPGRRFETAVTFQDVSTSEKDGVNDACPNCGTRVESAISAPGEPVREATQRRCPNCGKVLQREVGGKWTIDEMAS